MHYMFYTRDKRVLSVTEQCPPTHAGHLVAQKTVYYNNIIIIYYNNIYLTEQ